MKYIIIFFLLFPMISLSQEDGFFSPKKQFYIYGDAVAIGNNILSEHATKPLNNLNTLNDEIKMQYVDIDEDARTFSSSSATLKLPRTTKKIAYAALYWSAIYGYDKGVKRKTGNRIVYKGNNKRDNDFNTIKIKTPGNDYQEITGEIVYDGYQKLHFKENTPYVCYADVTSLINNNYNGKYTIANIKATQGYISGGSSAGWVLFVVYENETETPKYINTYDGLVFIDKEALNIKLSNFETVDSEEVKASLTVAALEGDGRLKRDQCFILNPIDNTFLPIFNSIRNEKNFFNSSITREDNLVANRTPNSPNTLGFDLAEISIPNPNNSIISNKATETTLQFRTKSDRFHLFFTAFKTEINPAFYDQKNYFDLTDSPSIAVNVITNSTHKNTQATARKKDIVLQEGSVIKQENQKEKYVELENNNLTTTSSERLATSVTPQLNSIEEATANKKSEQEVTTTSDFKPETELNHQITKETEDLVKIDIITKENSNSSSRQEKRKTIASLKNNNIIFAKDSILYKLQKKKGVFVPNLESGFYVITNVFTKAHLAVKWNQYLRQKGYSTKMFINPENNWWYISIFNTEDAYKALEVRNVAEEKDYFKAIWVFKVGFLNKSNFAVF